jgi:chemotaxis protein methyltransferase CheR
MSAGGNLSISAAEYAAFQTFLEKTCGIVLGAGKEYLVTSRLNGILKEHGLDSYKALIDKLQHGFHSPINTQVVDAMTTNETFWFRDLAHFRILTTDIYPEFTNKRVKIWSAACSTGQEPYTISMNVADYKAQHPGDRFEADIMATDISPTVLKEAREGFYCGMSASRGVDQSKIGKYFEADGGCIKVKPDIKRRVTFRELNLTQSYSSLGKFDVIFCRNVLIYFSAEMKFDIVQRLAQSMNPGGYLFLGSTEAPPGLKDFFDMKSISGGIIYKKKA